MRKHHDVIITLFDKKSKTFMQNLQQKSHSISDYKIKNTMAKKFYMGITLKTILLPCDVFYQNNSNTDTDIQPDQSLYSVP